MHMHVLAHIIYVRPVLPTCTLIVLIYFERKNKQTKKVTNQSEEFAASRGWLESFLKYHEFAQRRSTALSQLLPKDISKVRVRKMWLLHQYASMCIGNMDETPLWLDMPGDTTMSRVGKHWISVHTAGHDKARFTVILAALANVRKLKRFVVYILSLNLLMSLVWW